MQALSLAASSESSTEGAFWTPIDVGLTSPQIHALAVDPKTSGVVCAGTALGGVFKTTNGGASWSARNAGLPFPGQTTDAVFALAIDQKTPTTLYAGTLTGGIFKSTNGGDSWSQSFSAGAAVNVLAIDPLTPTTLYAGTVTAGGTPGRGVYKTMNGGVSWIQSNSGLGSLHVHALAVDPTTPAIVYAATFGGGLFRSSNGGAIWSASNQGGLTDLFLLAVTVDPKSPTTVYVGTLNSGIFKSTNGGASWSPSNAGLPSAATITALAIDPLTPLTLYAGLNGDGVFNTVNGGAGWKLEECQPRRCFCAGPGCRPANRHAVRRDSQRGCLQEQQWRSELGGQHRWDHGPDRQRAGRQPADAHHRLRRHVSVFPLHHRRQQSRHRRGLQEHEWRCHLESQPVHGQASPGTGHQPSDAVHRLRRPGPLPLRRTWRRRVEELRQWRHLGAIQHRSSGGDQRLRPGRRPAASLHSLRGQRRGQGVQENRRWRCRLGRHRFSVPQSGRRFGARSSGFGHSLCGDPG